MSGDNSEPLLGDVESWGNQPTIEEVEDDVTEYCSVDELLVKHHTRVLRYVQEKGVALLGEFEEEDNLVFPAFAEAQLLCFGADDRKLDYETEWRKRLKEAGGKRAKLGGWSNKVAVEAFVVTIRGAAAPDSRGLLQPLLKRYQAKRCSYAVFALPAVQAVIHFKWTTYARRVLMVELFLFLLWLISFNVFTIAFQDEDLGSSLHDLLRTARGRVTVAAEIMALVGMAPFLLLEVGTISAYGFGWLDLWNSLDMLTYCTQIGVTICHLGRFWTKSDLLTTLLVIQSILLVFRLQWYTQALQTVRMAYLPIIKEVWVSLRPAFFLMLLVMWGYATAFCCALRNDQEAQEEYSSIITSFLSMFEHQYGDVELTPMLKTKSPIIATSLAVSYIFVQGTIIINVLLGIVLASIERASQNEGMKMLLNQAKIIDEIESTLPSWVEKRWPHWFPPFVHILRIIPEKLDRVEQDALWSLMGRDEPQALQSVTSNPLTNGHPRHTGSADLQEQGSGGEGDGGQEEGGQGEGGGEGREQAGPVAPSLQKQMAAMQRQMERQERLLQRMCAQLALPQGAGSAGGREGLDSS